MQRKFLLKLDRGNEGDSIDDVFTMDELVQNFSLDGLGRAGAVVDFKRLKFINGEHIKRMCSVDADEATREAVFAVVLSFLDKAIYGISFVLFFVFFSREMLC